jgi:hypothetical protein
MDDRFVRAVVMIVAVTVTVLAFHAEDLRAKVDADFATDTAFLIDGGDSGHGWDLLVDLGRMLAALPGLVSRKPGSIHDSTSSLSPSKLSTPPVNHRRVDYHHRVTEISENPTALSDFRH